MSQYKTTGVYTMEAANLFCGTNANDSNASNHLTLTELKLPGLDEQYVDHRAGGAPVTIEIDTVIAKLESNFTVLGWTPQIAALVKSWEASQNMFTAYGVIRERVTGNAIQAIASITGKLGRADSQSWRRGDVQHWQYAIKGIIHYELRMGNEQMVYFDFFTNQLIIGGTDRNAETNNLLVTGAGAPPVTAVT